MIRLIDVLSMRLTTRLIIARSAKTDTLPMIFSQ